MVTSQKDARFVPSSSESENTRQRAEGPLHCVRVGTNVKPYCLSLWFMSDVVQPITSIVKHAEEVNDQLPLSLYRKHRNQLPSGQNSVKQNKQNKQTVTRWCGEPYQCSENGNKQPQYKKSRNCTREKYKIQFVLAKAKSAQSRTETNISPVSVSKSFNLLCVCCCWYNRTAR